MRKRTASSMVSSRKNIVLRTYFQILLFAHEVKKETMGGQQLSNTVSHQ